MPLPDFAYSAEAPVAPAAVEPEAEPVKDPLAEYFARAPVDRIGEKLVGKVESYATAERVKARTSLLARAYQYYYGLDPSGVHGTSQVIRGGDVGELAMMRVNHSRSLVNALRNLITSARIVWTAKAVNVDYDSLRQCELAQAVLEYYWADKSVGAIADRALEGAVVFSEWFVLAGWDENAGDPYLDDPAGGTVKSGDPVFTSIPPWDVIRDPNKPNYEACEWVIVRQPKNKYDLAADHPDYTDLILRAPQDIDPTQNNERDLSDTLESDDVSVYTFLHRPTPSMPVGRRVVFLANRAVLADEALEEFPLYRVSAGETTGTPYGYTPYFEVLGVQELIDSLHTSIATNQTAFGTQCILLPEGSQINPDEIAGGMKAIYYPQTPGNHKPEALQLTRTPPELFQHLEALVKDSELLMGLNSVVRGEPQSGEMSGSALALLQSQALQQSSTLQANWIRFVEQLGTCVVNLIRKYASIPQKVALVGKGSAYLVTEPEFSKDSFARIKKIQVEIGSPMAQNAAGRSEMAKELIDLGMVKTPEQYLQVLRSGRLEPLTASVQSELMLIRSENEQLAEGEIPPVVALDDHQLHMREHRAVLANPSVRRDPRLVDAVLAHITEHETLYYTVAPQTLAMVGQVPPPMVPGMAPPGGEPGGGAPPPAAAKSSENPAAGKPPAKPPEMPTNPATEQKWDPVSGGLGQ